MKIFESVPKKVLWGLLGVVIVIIAFIGIRCGTSSPGGGTSLTGTVTINGLATTSGGASS